MSLNRVMASRMAGSNVKMIHGEVIRNVDPYMEWTKWLSYVPEFQKERIQELDSKRMEEMTLEEVEELEKYKNQNRMLGLFKIYSTSKISKDEYMEVYDYMANQSIDELMLSKLSSEELKYAKDQIQYFNQIPSEELRKKVTEEQKADNYENLSMVDSYVLHIISKINYAKSIPQHNREL